MGGFLTGRGAAPGWREQMFLTSRSDCVPISFVFAANLTPGTLADRFAAIIALLCRAVADHGPKQTGTASMLVQAWTRLRRLCARFTALAAAVEAGRFAAPRLRRKARRPGAPSSAVRLPSRFGWLLDLAQHVDTRIARTQVEHWLADPAVTALVETAPQSGRILRPLCRMLAIEPPPALRLPKRVRVRRAPPPAAAAPAGPPPARPSWLSAPLSAPLPCLEHIHPRRRASFRWKRDPLPD